MSGPNFPPVNIAQQLLDQWCRQRPTSATPLPGAPSFVLPGSPAGPLTPGQLVSLEVRYSPLRPLTPDERARAFGMPTPLSTGVASAAATSGRPTPLSARVAQAVSPFLASPLNTRRDEAAIGRPSPLRLPTPEERARSSGRLPTIEENPSRSALSTPVPLEPAQFTTATPPHLARPAAAAAAAAMPVLGPLPAFLPDVNVAFALPPIPSSVKDMMADLESLVESTPEPAPAAAAAAARELTQEERLAAHVNAEVLKLIKRREKGEVRRNRRRKPGEPQKHRYKTFKAAGKEGGNSFRKKDK